ncbi:MAG: helix-turn-helix domain-containing protein [Clostridiales bacterium]|nr:helix-turn-helix domain-containing protein [Clostridiales bacterium]
MTFGQRLTELRIKKGVSQEYLAELMQVSSQKIRRWEYDKNSPDINEFMVLCKIFEVSYAYLLTGEEDKGEIIKNEQTAEQIQVPIIENRKWKTNVCKIFIILFYVGFIGVSLYKIIKDGPHVTASGTLTYFNMILIPLGVFLLFTIVQAILYHTGNKSNFKLMILLVLTLFKTFLSFIAYFVAVIWSFNVDYAIVLTFIILIGLIETVLCMYLMRINSIKNDINAGILGGISNTKTVLIQRIVISILVIITLIILFV